MTSEIVTGPGGTTFAGEYAVELYRAIALRSALTMYAKHGMRVSAYWTPTAMMRTAGRITGNTYKARAYTTAIADLDKVIETAKRDIPVRRVP